MTMNEAIVDLAWPGWRGNDEPEDAYVFCSRVRTLAGLAVLRQFKLNRLRKKRPDALWLEMKRLTILAMEIINQYKELEAPDFPCNGRQECDCTECALPDIDYENLNVKKRKTSTKRYLINALNR
jgi:hypothetical protein